MRLILVRHGETREGKKGVILGSLGGHLTTQGKQEAKELTQSLITKKIIPHKIISSPLQRALDTAKIISHIFKIPIIQEPLTRERGAGIAEGKQENEIVWNTYEKKTLTQRRHKGGESFTQVYKRAKKFIEKLQKEYTTETILVVSHSVFILMCVAILKNRTIEQIIKNKPKEELIILKLKK
ncbi:MAG: histidine phosphatase family protein [Candidatus Paceibacterota bacterium]